MAKQISILKNMFPFSVGSHNLSVANRIIARNQGKGSKPRKYALYQFFECFIFIFSINNTTLDYEPVNVEPATHGEDVETAEVQAGYDEVGVRLRPLVHFRCYDKYTSVREKIDE